MKRIILETKDESFICFRDINPFTPIFVKGDGKLCGMINYEEDKGWIIKIGATFGSTGYHKTLENCLKSGIDHNYEYYIVD